MHNTVLLSLKTCKHLIVIKYQFTQGSLFTQLFMFLLVSLNVLIHD